MTDDRYETLLARAGAALRTRAPRDDVALQETLHAIRAAALDTDAAPHAAGAPRFRRRTWHRRRGALPYAAGLAAGIAFAAGLGMGLLAGWRMRGAAAEGARLAVAAAGHVLGAQEPGAARTVEFMLVAPHATRVALVGEFNGWDPTAAPMRRAAGGTWTTAVPLERGRHLYAFVVDDREWVPDPQAPLAAERWFGTRNSVLLVGEARP